MFTIESAAALTESQIELLTGTQLAQAYNVLAEKANVAQIKKFTDRPTGIKRLLPVVRLVRDLLAASAAVKPSRKAKASTVKLEKQAKTESLSAAIRRMIGEGLNNDEIRAALPELDEARKHYPQWYRSEMARAAKKAA